MCTRQNRVDSIGSVFTASLSAHHALTASLEALFASSLICLEIFVFTQLVSQSLRIMRMGMEAVSP
jgi:hypothetical protein